MSDIRHLGELENGRLRRIGEDGCEGHWSFDAVSWLPQLFRYESRDDIREALEVSDSADHELAVVVAWGYGKERLRSRLRQQVPSQMA